MSYAKWLQGQGERLITEYLEVCLRGQKKKFTSRVFQ